RDETLAAQPTSDSVPLPNGSVVMSTSFAFGGSNVALAFGSESNANQLADVPSAYFVRSAAIWAPGLPNVESFLDGKVPNSKSDEWPEARILPPRSRGRASMLTRMYAELYDQLTRASDVDPSTIATVYSSMFGAMATTMSLLDQMASEPRLSPSRFQGSVHNTAAGQLSLATKNHSFSTSLAAGQQSLSMTLLEARAWLACHGGDVFVLIADEHLPERLVDRPSFVPLGVGFHLGRDRTGRDLGSIGPVTLGPTATTSAMARREAPSLAIGSKRGASLAPLAASPAAWGLALLDALAEKSDSARIGSDVTLELFN